MLREGWRTRKGLVLFTSGKWSSLERLNGVTLSVSEDKTYLEYSASPSSFLSLSVKKLLQLSKPESAHWPKVKWNWRILTKIVLANLLPLLLLLLIEGIFFNCRNNKLGRALGTFLFLHRKISKLIHIISIILSLSHSNLRLLLSLLPTRSAVTRYINIDKTLRNFIIKY